MACIQNALECYVNMSLGVNAEDPMLVLVQGPMVCTPSVSNVRIVFIRSSVFSFQYFLNKAHLVPTNLLNEYLKS